MQKVDRKSMKLNEKMLRKASATVDLISRKVRSKNLIKETVTASFITNVIELTQDALQTLQKHEQNVLREQMGVNSTAQLESNF